MAVQSDTSRIQYAGNNSTTTSYSVPFVFQENSHLKAIARTAAGVETVVTLTNHTGAGDSNGGTVRTAVAVPATSTLTIYREVPVTQTTSYAEGGDFPAASHERALDKLTMAVQQVARSINRTVRLSDAAPESTPLAVLPNRFFGTDENGLVALVTGTDTPAGSLTNANIASNANIALSKLATGALPNGITVSSANLVDGTIVNGDISDSAAITPSKLASNLDLSSKTVILPDGNITTTKIADGAVTAIKAAARMAVQVVTADYPTWATLNTAAIPADDTIPQSNEGTQLLTLSITPTSLSSKIIVYGQVYGSTNATAQALALALFRNSDPNAIFTTNDGIAASTFTTIPFVFVDSPSTTETITYSLRIGVPAVFYVNGSSAARRFGGTAKTAMVAIEIR